MQWKLGAAIALVVTCPALAEELDQSAVADALRQLDSMMPRPWCNAERLNPTERSICADRDLSRLDALLARTRGQVGRKRERSEDRRDAEPRDQVEQAPRLPGADRHYGRAAQLAWLRSERDACGTDSVCIARAYSARIGQLDSETW